MTCPIWQAKSIIGRGYFRCCGFTPESLEFGAAVGDDGSAGAFESTAAAFAAGAAVGAGCGTGDTGVAAGFTFAPSGTVLARLSTTRVPSPTPLMIFTADPSVPAISIGVSLM